MKPIILFAFAALLGGVVSAQSACECMDRKEDSMPVLKACLDSLLKNAPGPSCPAGFPERWEIVILTYRNSNGTIRRDTTKMARLCTLPKQKNYIIKN